MEDKEVFKRQERLTIELVRLFKEFEADTGRSIETIAPVRSNAEITGIHTKLAEE